ncbi:MULTISPECIES: PAS domain S-box protein [Corallococcus]|uniref:PAS domain-containing sensor histidine kinase n=1 Tax=Corallococcus TaxID=83461 RepID=UPI000EC5078B|nr:MULTISPECIES: PAS domain S-box protein [Corallococcus]NRD44634.1 PAS domain S-box protein [Corallococcus exiguus]RKI03836.1 PAS domain S-box protein [Corallococcus sp. AB038B]
MAGGAARELEAILDAAVDPIIACGPEERILHVNAGTERLLGWDREQLVGRPITDLFPPRLHHFHGLSLPRYLLSRRKALGGRPTRVFARRRDGVELQVEVTVGATGLDGDERIVFTMRRMHEVIDSLEEPVEHIPGGPDSASHQETVDRLYRLLVENAPLGIFHFDRTPVITACNERFSGLIGTSKRNLVGLQLLTLRDERIMACVRESLAGRPCDYEGDYRSITTGKVTPVRVRFAPCYSEDGTVVEGGVGIVEDITERRRVEAEREENLAQLDLLVRSAPVGIGFLDTNLRYVRVNETLARINGIPAEDHPGRTLPELLGEPGTIAEQGPRYVLRTGEPMVGQESVSDEDLGVSGPRRCFRGSFYPVRTPDGRVLGVGVLIEDITERRRAEEERAHLYREAQEAIRVRDDFLSIASHELKTPLTPLSLRLATLERRLERGENLDPGVLRHARHQLTRLTGLINDLLDASRIEAGRLSLHPESTRFDLLVEQTLAGMEGQKGNHTFDFEPPREPVSVHGDTFRLEQVISNLLENALKYSPDGGTIRVRLSLTDDVAVLSVTDPGIGIPEDQQQQLFDRYFRARNASTRSYGGLGLGLYISRDIVERHGGRIWVESEPGRGSTFYVALPTLASVRPALPQVWPDRHLH